MPIDWLSPFPWQDVVACLLAAVSAGYIGYVVWGAVMRRKEAGCGGGTCKSCPAEAGDAAARPAGFVSIDEIAVRPGEGTTGQPAASNGKSNQLPLRAGGKNYA